MGKLSKAIVDRVIRHKAAIDQVPLDRFTVRIARSAQEYYDALRLLRIAYVMQGYEDLRAGPIRITPYHLLPESTVLVAYEGETLVGTMTVTLDSKAGLPSDEFYQAELDVMRSTGARIVEYGSLAVRQPYQGSGVTLLLNMAAYRLALNQLKATHCICMTVPRAVPVYRAMFDFTPLGGQAWYGHLRVEAQGMVHDLVKTQAFVRRHFRKPMASGRLPLEHFLGEAPGCVHLPVVMPWNVFVRYKASPEVSAQLRRWQQQPETAKLQAVA